MTPAVLIFSAVTATTSAAALPIEVAQKVLAVEPGGVLGRQGLVVVDEAGITAVEVGDVLLGVDRTRLYTLEDLRRFLLERQPGERVVLTVQREGERIEIETTLAKELRPLEPLPGLDTPSGFAPANTMTFAKDPEPAWYGWQMIPFDLIAIGLGITAAYVRGPEGTALLGAAVATYAAPSPLIHLAHNNQKSALYSVGARIAFPLLVAMVGGGGEFELRSGANSAQLRIGSASILAMVIMAIAIGTDYGFLAFEKPPRRSFEW